MPSFAARSGDTREPGWVLCFFSFFHGPNFIGMPPPHHRLLPCFPECSARQRAVFLAFRGSFLDDPRFLCRESIEIGTNILNKCKVFRVLILAFIRGLLNPCSPVLTCPLVVSIFSTQGR